MAPIGEVQVVLALEAVQEPVAFLPEELQLENLIQADDENAFQAEEQVREEAADGTHAEELISANAEGSGQEE